VSTEASSPCSTTIQSPHVLSTALRHRREAASQTRRHLGASRGPANNFADWSKVRDFEATSHNIPLHHNLRVASLCGTAIAHRATAAYTIDDRASTLAMSRIHSRTSDVCKINCNRKHLLRARKWLKHPIHVDNSYVIQPKRHAKAAYSDLLYNDEIHKPVRVLRATSESDKEQVHPTSASSAG
jgi:hypothetical protein